MRQFWSQIKSLFDLHKLLRFYKFVCVDLKYGNSFFFKFQSKSTEMRHFCFCAKLWILKNQNLLEAIQYFSQQPGPSV